MMPHYLVKYGDRWHRHPTDTYSFPYLDARLEFKSCYEDTKSPELFNHTFFLFLFNMFCHLFSLSPFLHRHRLCRFLFSAERQNSHLSMTTSQIYKDNRPLRVSQRASMRFQNVANVYCTFGRQQAAFSYAYNAFVCLQAK